MIKKVFKLLLATFSVIVIVLVVGISVWWQRQYWTYHYNFRIEKVTMEEVVLDSITDSSKTYLLILECKGCNSERRWRAPLPSFIKGIADKVSSISVLDSANKNVSSNLKGVTKYKDIDIGNLYLGYGSLMVKASLDIDSLGIYLNSLTDGVCDYRYNKETKSFYVSMLYRLKDKREFPKKIVVKLGKRTFKAYIPDRPEQKNVSCIIPKGQEDRYESDAIRNSWHYDFDRK